MTPSASFAPLGDVVVDPDRQTARRWAVEELARPEYQQAQPSLLQRLLGRVVDALEELLSRAEGVSSGTGLLVGLAVVVVVVLVALLLAGPLRRWARVTRTSAGSVFGASVRTAAEHRLVAESAAHEAQWATAIQERFRATVRTLEERVLVDVRPGRTADELAREAGRVLPGAAAPLAAAARAFDDVTYGERPGSAERYRTCVEADEAAMTGRPVAAGDAMAVPEATVRA